MLASALIAIPLACGPHEPSGFRLGLYRQRVEDPAAWIESHQGIGDEQFGFISPPTEFPVKLEIYESYIWQPRLDPPWRDENLRIVAEYDERGRLLEHKRWNIDLDFGRRKTLTWGPEGLLRYDRFNEKRSTDPSWSLVRVAREDGGLDWIQAGPSLDHVERTELRPDGRVRAIRYTPIDAAAGAAWVLTPDFADSGRLERLHLRVEDQPARLALSIETSEDGTVTTWWHPGGAPPQRLSAEFTDALGRTVEQHFDDEVQLHATWIRTTGEGPSPAETWWLQFGPDDGEAPNWVEYFEDLASGDPLLKVRGPTEGPWGEYKLETEASSYEYEFGPDGTWITRTEFTFDVPQLEGPSAPTSRLRRVLR